MRYLFILLLMANIAFFVWTKRLSPPIKKTFTPVDTGVTQLQLVAEIDPTEDEPIDPIINTDINDDVQQMCFSVGPFDIEANIHAASETLNPVVLKTNIRKITTTQEAGYWVYLPALSSRAEALKKGRELAAAFVKDYYVVTSGDNENSISLGLYREPFNADSRIAELSKKGFQVSKEIRIEQWPEFWLDYSATEQQLPNIPNLKDTFPDTSQNEVICKNS
ncbi:MAG: SPOR domain-containing protein [Marinicella sp.]